MYLMNSAHPVIDSVPVISTIDVGLSAVVKCQFEARLIPENMEVNRSYGKLPAGHGQTVF